MILTMITALTILFLFSMTYAHAKRKEADTILTFLAFVYNRFIYALALSMGVAYLIYKYL